MSARAVRSPRRALSMLAAAGALAVSAAAADAQGLRHDSSLPIEITADTLEVQRDEQVATFTGNVDAVQGDLTLTADELRVYYRGDGRAAGADSGTIRLIEAEGNVFLTSPRETAQGAEGLYDVAARTVTLEGSVVLTRDDNVIKGDRLEMDLETGRSRVLSAARGADGAAPSERVRAIFVPQSNGSGEDAPAPQSSDAPGGDEPSAAPRPPASKPAPEPSGESSR